MLTRSIELELRAEKTEPLGAVLSTEAPVIRRDYGGAYREVLSHDPKAIDLARAPLPLLEGHDRTAMPIGLIENLRVERGRLRGEVRFGSSQRAKEIEADVRSGIIRNLSIGYSIEKVREEKSGDIRTITATRWTPYETSVVSVGADPDAGFGRSKEAMNENQTPSGETSSETLAERERVSTINALTRAAKADATLADELIRSGASVEAARSRIIDAMIARDAASNVPRGGALEIENDPKERIVADVVNGRMGAHELARTALTLRGERIPSNPRDLIARSMSSSDFPALLSAATGKSLRTGYENEPASHRAWVRVETVRDFKLQRRPILGAAPALEKKGEGGEYKRGAMDEDEASYSIATYGRIVELTREALVNDDLGAFLRVLPGLGQAARRSEADTVYSLFAMNSGAGPTMQDGQPLFHASHANLTASGAFNHALLAAGRSLLRKQRGVGGGYLALAPVTLLVSSELEHDAELLLAAASRVTGATLEGGLAPWIKNLQLVAEPRLAEDDAFLIAGSDQIDTCELGLLEENRGGPYFEEKEDFDTDVRLFKCRHDFGAKFLDWRGIVRLTVA